MTADSPSSLRVLQRVVFPGEDLDLVPLYVETNMERGAGELAAEIATQALTGKRADAISLPVANAAVGEAQSSIKFGADVPAFPFEDADPRRSALITGGRRVSFDVLQRVPGKLLAPLDHHRRGHAPDPPGWRI